jgi:hypothetical protein
MLCELGGCVGVLALLRDTGKAVRTNSRGRSPEGTHTTACQQHYSKGLTNKHGAGGRREGSQWLYHPEETKALGMDGGSYNVSAATQAFACIRPSSCNQGSFYLSFEQKFKEEQSNGRRD